jgi:hypothetical protein
MRANPHVGHSYRQEFFPDVRKIWGPFSPSAKKVTAPYGTLENCIQIRASSPLDPTKKFQCFYPDVGFLALEEVVGRGAEVEHASVTCRQR